ncbi:MAG: CRTAC1 family protein [bacterium]
MQNSIKFHKSNRWLPFTKPVRLFASGFLALALIFCAELPAQNFHLITSGEIAADTTNTNGASWVDFDGDGDVDLFLSNANLPFGGNTLYRNDGHDRFTRLIVGEVPNLQTAAFGHAWADYDNDGLPDLFVVNAFTGLGSILYKNAGGGRFQRNEAFYTGHGGSVRGFNAAWGDYDLDGLVDLVVTHPARFVGMPITSNFLFHNEGGGYFSEVQNTPITQAAAPFTNATWSDYDLDGDLDLFIGSGPANGTTAPDYHYKNLLKENGKAAFQRIKNTAFTRDSLDGQVWNWVDYDNDGDLDAFVTNWGGTIGGLPNNLYRNLGGADSVRYQRVREGAIVTDKDISLANVWGDFDNDADLDVYVGNGSNQRNRFYRNNGDGTFTRVKKGHYVEQKKNTWGVCAGDYDNDGDLDLFVSNKTRYVRGGDVNFLYRNDLNNGHNWVLIQCVGVKSNNSALGTKIWVTTKLNGKTITQYREVGSQSAFLGQNDVRAHFGLNRAQSIDTVKINWPSGENDTYSNVQVNRLYLATESQGLVVQNELKQN